MIGTRIGAFELVRKLGQGGMGVVYQARHERLPLLVAIKLIFAASSDAEAVRRALAEAEALCAVAHPGVVKVGDFGQLADGTLFLVMENLQGESLRDQLRRMPGPQDMSSVFGIGRQVAAALAEVHSKGIVHRDLTPANLILVDDPELAIRPEQARVKVVDFGIARFIHGEHTRTQPGSLIGTPRYMSPEQCEANTEVGPPSDVYSLGIVLFELLVGESPYEGPDGDMRSLLRAHRQQRPRRLRELRPEVPSDVEQLIAAMLAKRPERRPTMKEVASRLHAAQQAVASGDDEFPSAAKLGAPATQSRSIPRQPTPQRATRWMTLLGLWIAAWPRALRSAATLLVAILGSLGARWLYLHPTSPCGRIPAMPGMVCIPGGSFLMGSSDSEITRAYADCQRYSDRCDKEFYLREQPLRRVTLSPFLMGQNEVTNREFAGWLNHPEQQLTVESGRMVRDNRTLLVDLATDFSGILYEKDRYVVRPGAADQPVVYVTWYGARAYCRSLGRDLPTEAQWEWAARGANTSRASFPWGSELPTCGGVVMSGPPSGVCSRPRGGPATVGTAPQDRTPQGVFDLGGNVEEWVQDRFLSPYPDCGDCRDPIVRTGTGTSEPEVQVIRGGSHREIPTATRSAGRAQSRADHVDAARGFRCASQPTQ